jgi:hypothetical protein
MTADASDMSEIVTVRSRQVTVRVHRAEVQARSSARPSIRLRPVFKALMVNVPALTDVKPETLKTDLFVVVAAFRLICLRRVPFQYTPTVPQPEHLVATMAIRLVCTPLRVRIALFVLVLVTVPA